MSQHFGLTGLYPWGKNHSAMCGKGIYVKLKSPRESEGDGYSCILEGKYEQFIPFLE